MKKKIYFIPGTMTDERLWQKLEPFFNDSYELIYLKIPLANSYEKILLKLLDDIKEEEVNLVGFSLGAYLASHLAIKYPKKIGKLFLISSSFSSLSTKEIEERNTALNIVKKFGFKGLSRKKIQTLISFENQENMELIELISNMYISLGEENFINQINITTKRDDIGFQLIDLKLPITIVYGSEDNLINAQYFETLKLKNSDIIYKKINTQSHMLPLEFAKSISGFIKEWIENEIYSKK